VARPNWEYIRVDVLMPGNPKLDGLTYAAKWTLIELWCHCGHHLTDGFVRDAVWGRTGTALARQMLVKRGLARRVRGGYQMHDYLEHQRSRAEVLELKEKRRKAGEKGGHAKASATASAIASAKQVLYQNASKPLAEAEAEAEADFLGADVGNQSSDRNARDDLTDLIINELRMVTGRIIDRQWAAKTRGYILDGRHPADPAAYIRTVIRNEPDPKTRFLPLYPD
jgi:hypothetical protein